MALPLLLLVVSASLADIALSLNFLSAAPFLTSFIFVNRQVEGGHGYHGYPAWEFPHKEFLSAGDFCALPFGIPGICTTINRCQVLVYITHYRDYPITCCYHHYTPIVCCPRDKIMSDNYETSPTKYPAPASQSKQTTVPSIIQTTSPSTVGTAETVSQSKQTTVPGIIQTTSPSTVGTAETVSQSKQTTVPSNIQTTSPSTVGTAETALPIAINIGERSRQGESCTLPSGGGPGICSRIEACPEIVPSILDRDNPLICSFDNYNSIICCPLDRLSSGTNTTNIPMTRPTTTPRPPTLTVGPDSSASGQTTVRSVVGERNKQACDMNYQALRNLRNSSNSPECEAFYYEGPGVVGGEPALPREFPHMAAVGFGPEDNIGWRCGGSLISSRYVLTAAHCVTTRILGQVRWVRLGDLDLYNDTDDARPQQFSVVERVVHPDYQPPALYNDLALLRLDRDAIFDAYVRPACLNTEVDLLDNVGDATGWGLANWAASAGTSHLQKATLPVQPGEECAKNYNSLAGGPRLRNGYDDSSMLCVGDRQGEKDTCKGDSGGPYLRQPPEYLKCLHTVAGITSFGKTVCGAVNSPSVYTRVSKFVPWIESIAWP